MYSNKNEDNPIKVKIFGILREKMGNDHLILYNVQEPITLNDLRKLLRQAYPSLYKYEKDSIYVVNNEIVSDEYTFTVTSSDEIALLPSINGL